MEKEEIKSLAHCIKDIFEGAYFGYTMIYSFEVQPNNSFRMAYLVDCSPSPFMEDLKKHKVKADVRMFEFVIYKTVLRKEMEMIITNTRDKNEIPITIPIDNELKKILYKTHKTWSIDKITDYLINSLKK